jgi:uncharacterized protein
MEPVSDVTAAVTFHPHSSRQRWNRMADPIHGLIQFDRYNPAHAVVLDVINTQAFQRLRRIKQMGLAEFVFPGATHNRFIHSLGSTHLMMKALSQLHRTGHLSPDDTFQGISVELLALVAIAVHDIGHPPLSHTLESAIDLAGLNALHDQLWNQRILREDPELQAIFAPLHPQFADILLAFIGDDPAVQRHPLSSLVSSQLDLDRLDYLQRDSHFLGVQYGRIETERLIMNLELVPRPDGQTVVAIREEALPAVEHYLFGRHQAYKMAMHPLDKSAEVLLRLTLARFKVGVQSGLGLTGDPAANRLYRLMMEPTNLSVADYLMLDDGTLWYLFQVWAQQTTDPLLAQLALRLLRHDLLKFVDLSKWGMVGPLSAHPLLFKAMRQAYVDAGIDWPFGFFEVALRPKPLYQPRREPIWIASNRRVVDIREVSSLPLDMETDRGERHLVFLWDKTLRAKLQHLLDH